MRIRLAGFLLLPALLCSAIQAHAAPKYPTYHVNELYLTPIKVQTTNSIGQFGSPEAGKTFLAVTLNVVNRDDVENGIGYDELKIVAQGQSIGEDDFNTGAHNVVDTVLEPGAKYTGSVVFDIPIGLHGATLSWAPSAPLFPQNMTYPVYRWNLRF